MPDYILTERIPLDRANYINEMVYTDFRKFCTRCDNEHERHLMYNKIKKMCNDIIINNGSMTREYKFSDSMEHYGRLSSNGMQGVMREFRGFLMGTNTTDVDQKNSHPVILSYLCHKHGIPCDAVDEYIKNRERVLETFYPVSKSDAKCELLKSINNDQHNKNNKNLFYKKWDKEIQNIQKQLLQIPEYKVIFDTVPVDKAYNKLGSKISRILCHHENLILHVALSVITESNIEVATLMADGCMIYGDHYENEKLLENIRKKCNSEFEGLNMEWTYKPHCQDIVIPEGWKSKKLLREIEKENKTEIKEKKKTTYFKDFIPYDFETDVGVAKFIIQCFPDKFIWIKNKKDSSGVMYSWTGKRWETGNLEFMRCISGDAIKKLHDIKSKIDKDLHLIEPKMASALESALSNAERNFQIRTKQFKYMESTEPFLINETVKFDNNPDIIGFNNGVYDLISHEFREVKYSDYLTMSCGYDYNPTYEPDKMEDMLSLLKTIIPDEETRNLMLEVMSAGLTGRVIETFVLFNGKGRNGKGLLDEFLQLIYGDYCLIYANVSLLTEKQKTGGNPELATIDNKRIVIMKEPDDDEPLQNSTIKSITGGGNISGRMLYSNKTNVDLSLILIMECNVRPKFKSAPGDAEEDRVIDILFPNRFTTKEDEVDNVSVFKGNSLYKTKEWKESHRDAFLQILIGSYKKLQKNEHVLKIPAVVAKRTMNYLNQSFPIMELFNDYYVKTNNKETPLKLKEVYDKLKNTDTFYNFTKEQKRKYNLKNFYEFFETHRTFREHYKERTSDSRNVLYGYELMRDDIVVVEKKENIVLSETDIIEM